MGNQNRALRYENRELRLDNGKLNAILVSNFSFGLFFHTVIPTCCSANQFQYVKLPENRPLPPVYAVPADAMPTPTPDCGMSTGGAYTASVTHNC